MYSLTEVTLIHVIQTNESILYVNIVYLKYH